MSASTETSSHVRGRPVAAVILAAGKGKRMKSDLPKVAHEAAGKPIVWWVVDAVRKAGASPIVLVVGHGEDIVRSIFAGDDADLIFVTQEEQLGTGHATRCAEQALSTFRGDILVLAGDGPLIRPSTVHAMIERQRSAKAAGTLATSIIDDPTGYGRVVRDEAGRYAAIVEQKNATEEQLCIHEVYPSYACFDAELLFAALTDLPANELTGEYYITDVPAMLQAQGHTIELADAVPPEDVLSINTPQQLDDVSAILQARLSSGAGAQTPSTLAKETSG